MMPKGQQGNIANFFHKSKQKHLHKQVQWNQAIDSVSRIILKAEMKPCFKDQSIPESIAWVRLASGNFLN